MSMVKNNKIFLGIIVVALVFGITGITFASGSFVELMAKYAGQAYADKLPVPDMSTSDYSGNLGNIASTTVGWSSQPNIAFDGSYNGLAMRFDMGDRNSNGFMYGYQGGNCAQNTTTLFAIQNTQGKTIWIADAGFTETSSTSTPVRVAMGTSTRSYIMPAEAFMLGTNNDIAGIYSILYTGNIAATTATGTTFWLGDYRGVDTRDASGTYYNVPVLAGQYLVGFATGTASSVESGFRCTYQVLYKTTDSISAK